MVLKSRNWYTSHFCPQFVKGCKRHCKKNWVNYSFRIFSSWRTFLFMPYSCIYTNKKEINFKKYLKPHFINILKPLNHCLQLAFSIWGQYSRYHKNDTSSNKAKFCIEILEKALFHYNKIHGVNTKFHFPGNIAFKPTSEEKIVILKNL